jgi:hypothetical protein
LRLGGLPAVGDLASFIRNASVRCLALLAAILLVGQAAINLTSNVPKSEGLSAFRALPFFVLYTTDFESMTMAVLAEIELIVAFPADLTNVIHAVHSGLNTGVTLDSEAISTKLALTVERPDTVGKEASLVLELVFGVALNTALGALVLATVHKTSTVLEQEVPGAVGTSTVEVKGASSLNLSTLAVAFKIVGV